MPTATKKRATNSTGGTAVKPGLVMCRKVVFKEGTRTIYNGTYAETNWPEITGRLNSLFHGLASGKKITFTAESLMARPTVRN